MRRILCAVLAAAMLVSALALAEGTLGLTAGSTEQKLESMIPVLDSLATCLNIGSKDIAFQVEYDPEDSHLVWNQLWRLASDYLAMDPQYHHTADSISVPAEVMDRCAAAAFGGMLNPLPAIPETDGESTVRYDPATDTYRVELGEEDEHYMAIESYASDRDALVINCGIYDGETGERMGGMTARLESSENTPAAAMFPYVVTAAHVETKGDFEGLWANLCDIRYTAPTFAPVATPEPTPTPAPTKSTSGGTSSGYRKLSSGDRGQDVRDLQKRLNKLGYNCGTPDGVFGSSTKRAVRYFQEAIESKSSDGVATAALQKKLFSSSAPEYTRYVTLKKGSHGIRVENLQKRLRELKYTAAPVDGNFGDRLKEAVKMFQQDAGLTADGVAGKNTLRALEQEDAPTCKVLIELQKGDSGDRVSDMQYALRELGFYTRKVNGKYDSKTVNAVAAFKEAYGLMGNGKTMDVAALKLLFYGPAPTEEPVITTEPTTTPEPTGDPDQPTEAPTAKPDEPTVKPDEPTAKPDEPTAKPDEPTAKPDEPDPDPEKPDPDPEKPDPEPEKPDPEPEKPDPEPEKPDPEPEKPAPEPEPEPKPDDEAVG